MHIQPGDIPNCFHQIYMPTMTVVELTHGTFHFRMTGMADQNAFLAGLAETRNLQVHLGHQRTSGIKHFQTALLSFFLHHAGHPMSTEYHGGIIRHFIQFIDKDRTLVP